MLQGLLYVGGKEANCLHMEVGGNFPSLGGSDFTKIILMRATVVIGLSLERINKQMTKIKTVCIPHKIRIPLRLGARGLMASNNFSLLI